MTGSGKYWKLLIQKHSPCLKHWKLQVEFFSVAGVLPIHSNMLRNASSILAIACLYNLIIFRVGGFNPLWNIFVKMGTLPILGMKNNKYLKLQASSYLVDNMKQSYTLEIKLVN